MTLFFLGLLALAWIAVFLPAVLRAREGAPMSTAERFRRKMSLIAPRGLPGRWVVMPESRDRLAQSSYRRSQERRTKVLIGLIAAAVLTGVIALLTGGGSWEVHLGMDALLALYVALLLETKRRRDERATKLRSLAARRKVRPEITFEDPVRAGGGRNN